MFNFESFKCSKRDHGVVMSSFSYANVGPGIFRR